VNGSTQPKLELLYVESCPHWRTAAERLATIAAELGLTVEHREVTTDAQAVAVGFHGSPTVLIDRCDPFATGNEPTGLACRLYRTPGGPAGSPTLDQLRAALS
jgi:hypothetical protein